MNCASEQSLCAIFRLLKQENGLDLNLYKYWAEIYYQTSQLVFPQSVGKENAMTPYKLKILLYYQILKRGYIIKPWNHLTEAKEKSNHHAQKLFYTKTMMGEFIIYHHDPMLLGLFFSFCQTIQLDPENEITSKTEVEKFQESEPT